jgi:hypothetical protein
MKRETAITWIERVAEFKRSGKTLPQWCFGKGLPYSTMYYWMKKCEKCSIVSDDGTIDEEKVADIEANSGKVSEGHKTLSKLIEKCEKPSLAEGGREAIATWIPQDNTKTALITEKSNELNELNEERYDWEMRLDIGHYSIFLKKDFDANTLKNCLNIIGS